MTTNEKSAEGHTPVPWRCNGTCIDGPNDEFVTWITGPDPERSTAIAAFIVRACNSHAALVEALKRIGNPDFVYASDDDEDDQLSMRMADARAALASVKS